MAGPKDGPVSRRWSTVVGALASTEGVVQPVPGLVAAGRSRLNTSRLNDLDRPGHHARDNDERAFGQPPPATESLPINPAASSTARTLSKRLATRQRGSTWLRHWASSLSRALCLSVLRKANRLIATVENGSRPRGPPSGR